MNERIEIVTPNADAYNKLDAYWKAAADFIRPRLADGDRLIAPSDLAACFPKNRCDSYDDRHSDAYQWIILHKGMLWKAKARGLIAASVTLEPVFANEVFVIFATRRRLKALSPKNKHYRSFLRSLESESTWHNPTVQPNREEIRAVVRAMISPIVSGRPNVDPVAMLLKDLPAMVFNIKNFGYELARQMSPALNAVTPPDEPQRIVLTSKATTSHDIESPWQAYWCKRLGIKPIYHRKIWELCYVAQSLWQLVNFDKSPDGIGFGCGTEPMPSLFASMGANITVTDLKPDISKGKGWLETGQHTHTLDNAFHPHLIDEETFRKRVTLDYVDMNAIPEELHGKFDFCWSICALEHLGSIQNGLDFIENSLRVLKPGGVAVHTTEYNFTDVKEIIERAGGVIYHRHHLEQIHQRLSDKGYTVCPLDFDVGSSPLDRFIDLPPYQPCDVPSLHLKLVVNGVPSTCFGLTIIAPG